jgi:ankyrin repeat protein
MSRYLNKRLISETNRGRCDRVETLLEKGADINRLGPDGFTPIMRAAFHGHWSLVRLLLMRGADPNITAADGAGALFWACVRGYERTAEILLAAGADVNAGRGGYCVLEAAISSGASLDLVQSLVMRRAWLQRGRYNRDFLQLATERGRRDVISLLNSMRRRLRRHRS